MIDSRVGNEHAFDLENQLKSLRNMKISQISSIPTHKIFRKIMKISIKFLQIVFISVDVICSACSTKLLNGVTKCPNCNIISPNIKAYVIQIYIYLHKHLIIY